MLFLRHAIIVVVARIVSPMRWGNSCPGRLTHLHILICVVAGSGIWPGGRKILHLYARNTITGVKATTSGGVRGESGNGAVKRAIRVERR